MKTLDWLKDVFRNDDIVSAVSGAEVEPPFFDKERKRRAQIWTVVAYVTITFGAYLLAILFPAPPKTPDKWDPPGLVFLMEPGPGGGGGGGGDQSEEPPSVQKLEGEDVAQVAVEVEAPEEELVFEDPDKPAEPEDEEEPEEVEDTPEVEAPVVAQAPDDLDQKGLLEGLEDLLESAGSGEGGGSGTGTGTGIGEGEGSGLGPGTGGGFGGGAYRLGSGITPPQLRKQVTPKYTDEGLAKKIEGVVLLEVVILKEGKVGPVRVIRGLGAGLNQQAIDCVRQWAFVPAKLKGEPIDLLVEIQVEFRIL